MESRCDHWMNSANILEFPDFPVWLNVKPFAVRDCRGTALVLAFVNASSVWCAERIAELERWCARHANCFQLVVIQVPRFDSEREPARALKLLRSQGVAAPILLDHEWEAWRRFGIESWPTLVLIDAQGKEQRRLVGSNDDLDKALLELCQGQLASAEKSLQTKIEFNPEPQTVLRFPAGIAASEQRLYVADSGRHRILECTHAGRVLRQFGTSSAGLIDGGIDEAAFHRPRGLALGRDTLYVADAGNHAVRRIDLNSGRTVTLCGNGSVGSPIEGLLGKAAAVSLDHPYGVTLVGNRVLIAMAGDNRIWGYDQVQMTLQICAGTGALEHLDGSLRSSAFAQPCSLVALHNRLFVCDALSSSIRAVQLLGGQVQTLHGGAGVWRCNADAVKRDGGALQFPQAVALEAGSTQLLWVADTGNGRLCRLRLRDGELSPLPLPRRLHGVSGLAVTAGSVWIAETDAHAILCYDIAAGGLSEVKIQE
jgi:sugar lactone lactonase YvrE